MRDDSSEWALWLQRLCVRRRWSRCLLAQELRRQAVANGDRLPSDDNLIRVIAWWERGEPGPDEFYLGLLAGVYEEPSPQELTQVSVLEPVERCAFLRGLGAFAGLGATLAIREPWERLSLALRRPSSVDEKMAASLEPWRDSQAVSKLDKPLRAAGAALVHLK